MAAAQAQKEISFLYLSDLKPTISSHERGRKCLKKLQSDGEHGKLIVRDGWLICPVCNKGRVLKLRPDTAAQNLIVYCKQCGKETTVNIDECLCPCRPTTSA